MGETFMKNLLAFALALSIPMLAYAIPESPSGINFSVVGCSGIYQIDGDTFSVDCSQDTVEISTLTVHGDATFEGNISAAGTFSFAAPLVIDGFTHYGSTPNINIQTLVCAAGQGLCAVVSEDEGDLYISTGTAAGDFRNSRTGKGPY